jgi:hypothetical protein
MRQAQHFPITTFCGISEGVKGYTTTLATGENAALGALTYGYSDNQPDRTSYEFYLSPHPYKAT